MPFTVAKEQEDLDPQCGDDKESIMGLLSLTLFDRNIYKINIVKITLEAQTTGVQEEPRQSAAMTLRR
jgi:hypothetical protein